jgi:hypothetical protein
MQTNCGPCAVYFFCSVLTQAAAMVLPVLGASMLEFN